MKYFRISLILLHLAGCTSLKPVAPWQKGTLAKPEMSFDGDHAASLYSEHIYFSREAIAGGSSVGGGGCGCN